MFYSYSFQCANFLTVIQDDINEVVKMDKFLYPSHSLQNSSIIIMVREDRF